MFYSKLVAELADGGEGQEVIGRALNEEAIALNCFEDAAETIRCFEQRKLRIGQQLENSMCGSQAADAAADDCDARRMCADSQCGVQVVRCCC